MFNVRIFRTGVDGLDWGGGKDGFGQPGSGTRPEGNSTGWEGICQIKELFFVFLLFFLSFLVLCPWFLHPPLQRNVGFRISWGLEYAISRETEKGGKNTMIARRGEERRGARTCAREGEREIRTRREKEREASARQKTDR